MQIIKQYEAPDGTKFDSAFECYNYEAFIGRLNTAMNVLHCEKELNGAEYLQHTEGSVKLARDAVIDVLSDELGINGIVAEAAKVANHNHTIFGRYIDDSGNKPARSAWSRFTTMSPITDREYSQPFFLFKAEETSA